MPALRYSPFYRWLAETLRADIAQGVYAPGDVLPTEHELMRYYDLSSTTVRRALSDLMREGLIYRRAGKGTFVKRARVEEHLSRLTSFPEEMVTRGIIPSFQLVQAKACVPPSDVASELRLEPRDQAFMIERIQLGNGEPFSLARGYWLDDIGEQMAKHDLNVKGLYELLENELHTPLVEADESISAATADAYTARSLKVRVQSPLLILRRTSFTHDMRPVEHTKTFYRADRYEYKIRLER